jgi:hypothetical protein
MRLGVIRGAVAGAAGTTALNAVTYLDMSMRGRPSSNTPAKTVEALAERLRVSVPGEGEVRDNRLAGLGALSGIATGAAVGVAFGVLRRLGVRPRPLLGAVLIGLTAMATTDCSMAALGVSDPRTWRVADWLSDLTPHVVYGGVTAVTLQALDPD